MRDIETLGLIFYLSGLPLSLISWSDMVMASDWVLHLETNRWVRSIYNYSGELLREWDYPGGGSSPTMAGQGSSVAPRQRGTSRSTFSKHDAYWHIPFVPGMSHHASRLDHVQQQDPPDCDQTYANGQSPATMYQQLANHRVGDGVHSNSGAGTVANIKPNSPPVWSPGMKYEVTRETTGLRTGCASISDSSEVTASSESDASISRIQVDDLQRLSLRDRPASHMVLPYGASSYKMQSNSRRFFRIGRVFSVLCHENAGWHGTVLSEKVSHPSANPFIKGKYQEPMYSSIRRMVVVKEPITTYSGQGVTKAGLDRSKHAVIGMRGDRPRTVQAEPRMVKEPLEVDPARPDQKLDCMSRVNFCKVYTVEHNVKVLSVSKITDASRARFPEYAQSEFVR
ncbi:hypothetical protein PENCOP_c001G04677 [Penicillium coprophilum]|uniref:DUF6590 domain-containing protein n=1 Tax=Penicillium coprophilum TaxID=36646 RepID=A0A1V6V9T0_9EURO|nr:hypothetical protein PENCOP_c001G04677 [Penicillium coprophilum]